MAVKIFKTTDRVTVKVDDISLKVSPLNWQQKVEIQGCGFQAGKTGPVNGKKLDINRMMFLTIKYSVKGVEGVEDIDGQPYNLEFDDNAKKALTDDCVEDLLNLPCTTKMVIALMGMINGLPKNGIIYNPENPTEKLQGVEIVLSKKDNAVKSKKTKK